MKILFDGAERALLADTVDGKLQAMAFLAESMAQSGAEIAVSPAPTFCGPRVVIRGVPARPLRVAPKDVPSRKLGGLQGRASLLHAIAHIEYSAIDLALDHALRFGGMPINYYMDWLDVAIEEASHFRMLRTHLQSLGYDYGDFPVHDALWAMAMRTNEDCLVRMALVPRLLEARGLDATPPIQRRLAEIGDHEAVALLDIILRDEVGHVGLGDKWFRQLCGQRDLEPENTFRDLIRRHAAPWPQTPMNREARRAAGFSDAEMDDLTAGSAAR